MLDLTAVLVHSPVPSTTLPGEGHVVPTVVVGCDTRRDLATVNPDLEFIVVVNHESIVIDGAICWECGNNLLASVSKLRSSGKMINCFFWSSGRSESG